MNIDIGRAFTFVTEDPKGINKVLIGGGLAFLTLLAIITIIGWIPLALILIGYNIQLARNVIAGAQNPLPEWDNWGERIVDGFKGWLVGFVYGLPATIISGIFQAPSYVSRFRDSVSGTTTTGGAAAATSGLSALGSCLGFLLTIVFGMFVAAAVGRYAATSDLGQAFQIGAVFATVRQNVGTYLVISLMGTIVLAMVAALGLIAFCIGVFFTAFYSQLVLYHMYGQAHRATQGAAMQPAYGDPFGGQRPF